MISPLVLFLFILSQFSVFSVVIIDNTPFLIIQWGSQAMPNETLEVVLETAKNVTGRIVHLWQPAGLNQAVVKPFRDKIAAWKRNGARGVISAYSDYRIPGIQIYGSPKEWPLPLGAVDTIAYDEIVASGNQANFTFLNWDPNPWDPINSGPGYTIFLVTISLLFVVNLAIATYRIAIWIYTEKKVDFTLGFCCLCLEWVCNALRFIETIIFPNRNKYGLSGANIILTLPICLSVITLLLIIFFWLDLTADPFYKGKFLGIMKIPVIIIIIFLICLETSLSVVRVAYPKLNFSDICLWIYIILRGVLAILCFFAAYRILNSNIGGKKKSPEIVKKDYLFYYWEWYYFSLNGDGLCLHLYEFDFLFNLGESYLLVFTVFHGVWREFIIDFYL
jgi:hypothetical protein